MNKRNNKGYSQVPLGILISTRDVQYLVGKIGRKKSKAGENQDFQSRDESTFISLLITHF